MMSSLTPTVRLNSFAMAKQIRPLYEETTVVSKSEEKMKKNTRRDIVFSFVLEFEEFKVEGSAKTKQNAKHNAAEKMIEELKKKYPVEFAAKTALTAEEQMLLKLKGTSVTPLYQYVQEEGAADNRIHTVQCTVSTLTVEGKGRGRRNAREDAAKQVLEYLRDNNHLPKTTKSSASEHKPESARSSPVAVKSKDIASPAKVCEKLEGCPFGDAVSVLQEYLVHNNLDPPAYSTGLLEDKVYSVTCRAGGISYSSAAKTKKLAKQCAAAGVIDILGVKERPKKKPKKKNLRNQRYKFRYPCAPRGFGFDSGILARPKVYEPSQRAINFSRRNPVPDDSMWMSRAGHGPVQSYYDMF